MKLLLRATGVFCIWAALVAFISGYTNVAIYMTALACYNEILAGNTA